MDKALEALSKEKQKNKKARSAIREIVLAVLFAVLAMVCAYQMLDYTSFSYQKNLKNVFGAGDKSKTLYDVKQPSDIWFWAKNTLVPSLKSLSWYNGQSLSNESFLVGDLSSYVFGYAVMRQKRITNSNFFFIFFSFLISYVICINFIFKN